MTDTPSIDQWLSTEINHVWLLAELSLRQFQRAFLRPQPDQPALGEIEGIFATRRAARGGMAEQPADEDELTRALAENDARRQALRRASPIGRLSDALGLRKVEIETLIVATAPHIDSPLADVFALLRGAPARRGVDLALIAQLMRFKRADRLALLDVVDPDRPLLSWRMINVSPPESSEAYGSVTYRAIQPTFDMLSTLSGRSELSPMLKNSAQLIERPATLDTLVYDPPMRERLQKLCDAAHGAARDGRLATMPWIVLWGPRGIGKAEAAARLAAHAGRPLLSFNPSAVDRAMLDEMLRRVQREALLLGAVLYVGPMVGDFLGEGGRELLSRMINYPGVVVFGLETMQLPRFKVDRPMQEIEMKLPAEAARIELWERAVPEERRGEDVLLPSLARAFNLTPGEILDTADEATRIAQGDGGRQIAHEDLRFGVERRLRNELGETARRISVSVKWEDLVLPPEYLDRINEFISRRLYADRVFNEWGFGERIGYGRGMVALFSGPPGTGKTMLAGLIAKTLDLELYQVDLANVVSKWIGETEKQLSKVFDQAERAHAVLLFDEADSLFAKRTEVKSSNDRYGNLAVNYLLQRLEQYTGIAILTTNKEAVVDEALQRRLSLHLHFQIPDKAERERLWNTFLPDKAPKSEDIDLADLAEEYELSGGHIKNAALRAAFLAAALQTDINMDHLRRAAVLELEDMGRLAYRPDGGRKESGLLATVSDFVEG